jgi:lysozyme family protein
MTKSFKDCLELVLKHEGGFVNHKDDPGGMTNLGVTKKVWEEWVGHPVTEKDMKELTPEKVAPMYEMRYWRTSYCEKLPRGLDLLVFSMAVNAGAGRSVKLLQDAIGVLPDGVIGPNTMAKINEANVETLIDKFSEARTAYYKGLKTFPVFGKGWLSRTDKERLEALDMAKNG